MLDEGRFVLSANLLRFPAPRPEAAARGRVGGTRHVPFEHDPGSSSPLLRRFDRNRRQERLCIGVHRRPVDLLPRPDLDDLAEVHNGHTVGDMTHDGEIVCDEQIRESELLLQLLQEVHDLRLDRDVERGNGLVEHHHLRVQGQRPCHSDPLALAARELVREAVRMFGAQADGPQKLLDPTASFASRVKVVDPEGLRDDVSHRHPRIQRGIWILEDDLDVTSHRAHLSALELRDVPAVEEDRSGGGFDQLDDRAAQGRLSASRLPDDPERLALPHCQIDAVDGSDLTHGVLEDAGLGSESA